MTNVGLAGVVPPVDKNVMEFFQGLPRIAGVNSVGKGWNEFVLYGDSWKGNLYKVYPDYYYLYVAMTWDNGLGEILDEEGAIRGLFFENFVDFSVEGFYCQRDSSALYNWLCYSSQVSNFYWDPETPRLPLNREPTGWWRCGVEDRLSYTQAFCTSQLPLEDEEGKMNRIRYDPETNLMFWGLSIQKNVFRWEPAGVFGMAGAQDGLNAAGLGLVAGILAMSIAF